MFLCREIKKKFMLIVHVGRAAITFATSSYASAPGLKWNRGEVA